MTLLDPYDEAHGQAVPGTAGPDAWLAAAAAIRHAVLGIADVAGLSESARYQTCGRGRVVRGVALSAHEGAMRADVALIVRRERDVESLTTLARAVERVVLATWSRTGQPSGLDAHIHMVDLAAARRASDPEGRGPV